MIGLIVAQRAQRAVFRGLIVAHGHIYCFEHQGRYKSTKHLLAWADQAGGCGPRKMVRAVHLFGSMLSHGNTNIQDLLEQTDGARQDFPQDAPNTDMYEY